jgi:hypothetical protein
MAKPRVFGRPCTKEQAKVMPDPSPPWGDSPAGRNAVITLAVYLLVVFAGLVLSLAHNWPRTDICNEAPKPPAAAQSPQPPGAALPAAGNDGAPAAPAPNLAPQGDAVPSPSEPAQKPSPTPPAAPQKDAPTTTKSDLTDRKLLCLVAIVGALGGLIHAMRSYYAFVGNGQLKFCWIPMYILLPWVASALALLFFLVAKGLVPSLAAASANGNPSLFCLALAGIVGLFTEETVVKMQEIAQSILGRKQDQKDPLQAAPATSPQTPPSAATAPGTPPNPAQPAAPPAGTPPNPA